MIVVGVIPVCSIVAIAISMWLSLNSYDEEDEEWN